MQTVRYVLRALGALTAVLLVAGVPMLAGVGAVQAAVQASAGETQQHSAAVTAAVTSADSQPLAVSITGMTPTVPGPDSTVTVSGTLANHTGSALPGIAVQALTSTQYFRYPQLMTDFTNGTSTIPLEQAGEYQVPNSVPNGGTVQWSVSFPATEFYSQFGVFPIEVQVSALGVTYTASASTFLVFWPGGDAASQPAGLQAAWVWPLVDTPQQGACSGTLATNELASSVASGGRLSTLLNAGSSATAQKDDLTWDIDPALLSNVSVMTRTYYTHGNAVCSDRFPQPASKAASQWLSQLKTSTAGQPAFLTPYADVDVAALSHAGLDSNIATAYRVGDTVAGQILPNTFGKNGTGTADGAVLKAAWPADGEADAGVLTSLASSGGISTVILSSNEQLSSSSSSSGEDALARTVSGIGTNMSVLLANSRITSLLGTASAAPTEAGQFTLTQDFLAQTAMIAAETNTERSLVIAPPTNWNPSPAEASALLQITQDAPWLHPTGLSALSSAAAQLPSASQVPPKQVSPSELGDAYMDSLTEVQSSLNLFENLLYKPPAQTIDSLDEALAATESSAWRGRGEPGGWLAMGQLHDYLADSEHKVKIIGTTKKMLLFGQSGETPVSVENGLDVPIQVRVMASTSAGSQLQVGPFSALLTVQAGQTNTVPMPLHSATIGTTTVQLQLATHNGSPLTWPGSSQPLSVEVTRIGRSLLIIIGGALGILVLTSAYRLRRKRLTGTKNGGTADETADAGGAG
jgi:hypothetical protein